MSRAWLPACLLMVGCAALWTPLEPADDVTGEGGLPGPVTCPPLDDREWEVVGGPDGATIEADTEWNCETTYVLEGPVVISKDARLEVLPGTRVLAERDAMLLGEAGLKGGWLIVRGRPDAPVVFTPRDEADREPGAWRGIVLLGADDTNLGRDARVPQTLPDDDGRGLFGESKIGQGENCGELQYLRVEFAGGRSPAEGLPLAGLTFAGCGGSTDVDHVQVHGSTEGIGIYGGDVDLRQIVVTGSEHEGIEWTGGYVGDMQFVVVQQPASAGAALRGNNRVEDNSARPWSHAEVVNATLVGLPGHVDAGGDDREEHTGVVAAQGSGLTLTNSVVQGFSSFGFDVRGVPLMDAVEVRGSLFFDNGEAFPGAEAEPPDDFDDDAGFDENARFGDEEAGNLLEQDPELRTPHDRGAPDFRPGSDVVEAAGLSLPIDEEGQVPPFFEPTGYAGAFPLAGADDERTWMSDWTASPQD